MLLDCYFTSPARYGISHVLQTSSNVEVKAESPLKQLLCAAHTFLKPEMFTVVPPTWQRFPVQILLDRSFWRSKLKRELENNAELISIF